MVKYEWSFVHCPTCQRIGHNCENKKILPEKPTTIVTWAVKGKGKNKEKEGK